MKIEKIGVIGAGQMGNGIAHVCALAGYDVVMEDINAEALGKARATIERNLNRQATRGLITPATIMRTAPVVRPYRDELPPQIPHRKPRARRECRAR